MRSVLFVMALAAVAAAQPKPKPDKLVTAAGEAFAKAQAADAKGDLQEAIRQYERALKIVEHPNTVFNLADALRRAKAYDLAIASYTKYLELAPDAADRKAIEKLVHDLKDMKSKFDFKTDESDGILFVDGKPVGKPGTHEVTAGAHMVDFVTPITYVNQTCDVARGATSTCNMTGPPRVDGNVIISATWQMGGLSWPVEHQRFQVRGRFTAKPGHYELKVVDRQCAPLPLDVPAGDVLTYAYITYPIPAPDRPACIPLTITQQRVKF